MMLDGEPTAGTVWLDRHIDRLSIRPSVPQALGRLDDQELALQFDGTVIKVEADVDRAAAYTGPAARPPMIATAATPSTVD
jgi:hypothetical protein